MAGWQLLVLGYFLGAPLGFLLCSVLVASKDPPKPHTTCKDCVHRHKKAVSYTHLDVYKRQMGHRGFYPGVRKKLFGGLTC